ncbi:MAG: protein kinase domain-containing protein [Dolichospermum sp.]
MATILGGHYEIIKALGQGTFGETYLAKDTHLPDEPFRVVKRLKIFANPSAFDTVKRLFDTEAETLYKLGNHEQIPQLFAHFEENQEFYLVQELVDGHDLTEEIQPGRKFTETEVIEILREILEILVYVHQEGVIHRDIKPSNLMRRKSDGKIVMIDFGAVKQITTSFNKGQKTISIGTEGYMPVEQDLGNPKLCSDIYAVGMIGIQALTGIYPHLLGKDKNGEVLWQNHVNTSPELAKILNKMIRYDFNKRYQTPSEVLQALDIFASQVNTYSSTYKVTHVQPKFKFWMIPAIIALITIISFFVGFAIFSTPKTQQPAKNSPSRNIQW